MPSAAKEGMIRSSPRSKASGCMPENKLTRNDSSGSLRSISKRVNFSKVEFLNAVPILLANALGQPLFFVNQEKFSSSKRLAFRLVFLIPEEPSPDSSALMTSQITEWPASSLLLSSRLAGEFMIPILTASERVPCQPFTVRPLPKFIRTTT